MAYLRHEGCVSDRAQTAMDFDIASKIGTINVPMSTKLFFLLRNTLFALKEQCRVFHAYIFPPFSLHNMTENGLGKRSSQRTPKKLLRKTVKIPANEQRFSLPSNRLDERFFAPLLADVPMNK